MSADGTLVGPPIWTRATAADTQATAVVQEPPMPDRYARYSRLRFDRPHPRVLRIIMGIGQERPNPVDAVMHRELGEIWRDIASHVG